eukprot:TRINITY_DN11603_c0_g1_i1.p1 TRINITY_DN11603_c0_g1~~TRINITY_DN11603_c0_g1_i1.p1  ORF type:complete len:82 (-),score=15.71 TRINITY_DN11603_c0_g1_i1:317-562(-)
MVVGIDVNHDIKRGKSTVAFVCSDSIWCENYFTWVDVQSRGVEVIQSARKLMREGLEKIQGEKLASFLVKSLSSEMVCQIR